LANEAEMVIILAQGNIIGRAAEALRRRRTEVEALRAGVRTEAFRRVTTVRGCECLAEAQNMMLTAGIPETGEAAFQAAVDSAMLSVREGQTADLEDHPYGVFRFDGETDHAEVELATRSGRSSLITCGILRDSLCRVARLAAEQAAGRICPGLMAAAAESIAPVGPAPPTTVASATSTASAPPPEEPEPTEMELDPATGLMVPTTDAEDSDDPERFADAEHAEPDGAGEL
jgi:hypothetical protein